jgi:hypothetical protein
MSYTPYPPHAQSHFIRYRLGMRNFSFLWLYSITLSFLATVINRYIASYRPRPVEGSVFNVPIDIPRKYSESSNRFIVVSTQKSGSTYLKQLINANGMVGIGEAFRNGVSPQLVQALFARNEEDETVGFTLHFNQMQFQNQKEKTNFFAYLAKNDIGVIFLIRRFSIFILLSWMSQTLDRISKALRFRKFTDEDIRRYDREYASLSDYAKFYIDRKYFRTFSDWLSDMFRDHISLCKDSNVHFSVIYYEDLCEENKASEIFSEIFAVDDATLTVDMLKRHDNRISDILS